MENPPTPTKELALLQNWTHSFPSGLSSQSNMEHSWLFWGFGRLFYYVHWQFKAGEKHAGNLEAFELGGAELSGSTQLLSKTRVLDKRRLEG